MKKVRHYSSSYARESDFQMPEINVFFSSLIYETENDFHYEENLITNSSFQFEILHIEQKDSESTLIIMTPKIFYRSS